MSIREAFGSIVRLRRQAIGLSQEELAEHAGLHRTYIGSIERGERNVGLDNIYAIAAALRMPTGSLFTEIDNLLNFKGDVQ